MKITALFLLFGVIVLCALLVYMGGFNSIVIAEQNKGPFTFVYRNVKSADMKKIGEVTSSIDSLLKSRRINERRPLDIFHPDGSSEIGFVVEDASIEALEEIRRTENVKHIPVRLYMVTEFPWRNPMSFMIGYFKVDPALTTHREKYGYVKTEALALNVGDTIVYMQPIIHRDQ